MSIWDFIFEKDSESFYWNYQTLIDLSDDAHFWIMWTFEHFFSIDLIMFNNIPHYYFFWSLEGMENNHTIKMFINCVIVAWYNLFQGIVIVLVLNYKNRAKLLWIMKIFDLHLHWCILHGHLIVFEVAEEYPRIYQLRVNLFQTE